MNCLLVQWNCGIHMAVDKLNAKLLQKPIASVYSLQIPFSLQLACTLQAAYDWQLLLSSAVPFFFLSHLNSPLSLEEKCARGKKGVVSEGGEVF